MQLNGSYYVYIFLPAFHPKTGLDMLKVHPVSKAQARQRTGRAGRETSGVCYRLFTEEQFDQLQEMTTPEIQRCNLASVILQLMALGVTDVLSFDFLDRPHQDAIENALEQLVVLGAVTKGSDGFEVKFCSQTIIGTVKYSSTAKTCNKAFKVADGCFTTRKCAISTSYADQLTTSSLSYSDAASCI